MDTLFLAVPGLHSTCSKPGVGDKWWHCCNRAPLIIVKGRSRLSHGREELFNVVRPGVVVD